MEFVIILVFALLLGCIPASIAQSKGHDFMPWWFGGALLFIVALPWSLMLKDERPPPQPALQPQPQLPPVVMGGQPSAADEIRRFAALKADGLITPEEYETKRRQLLALPPADAGAVDA